ncbi:hypothetical protein D3C81_1442000 [compost metagenome]
MASRPVTHAFERLREYLHGRLRQQQPPHYRYEQPCHVDKDQTDALQRLNALPGCRVIGIRCRHQDLAGIILDPPDLMSSQTVEDINRGSQTCRFQVRRRICQALTQGLEKAGQLPKTDSLAKVAINVCTAQI